MNALPAEIRDGFGRLRRANDTIVRADYTYDAQDHLVRTDLVAGDTTQSRFWTYDGRGFLVFTDATGTRPGTIKHTRYDALGHARRPQLSEQGRIQPRVFIRSSGPPDQRPEHAAVYNCE